MSLFLILMPEEFVLVTDFIVYSQNASGHRLVKYGRNSYPIGREYNVTKKLASFKWLGEMLM
jgi:hypothetical protein